VAQLAVAARPAAGGGGGGNTSAMLQLLLARTLERDRDYDRARSAGEGKGAGSGGETNGYDLILGALERAGEAVAPLLVAKFGGPPAGAPVAWPPPAAAQVGDVPVDPVDVEEEG
jgi:hypothetical protein